MQHRPHHAHFYTHAHKEHTLRSLGNLCSLKSISWREFNHQSLQVECDITNQIVLVNASLFHFALSLLWLDRLPPPSPLQFTHSICSLAYSLVHIFLHFISFLPHFFFPSLLSYCCFRFSSWIFFFIHNQILLFEWRKKQMDQSGMNKKWK